MDRDALTQRYCGPYGLVMDGYYGLEQWEYKIVDGRMSYPVNFLPSLDALGTKITESQEEERNRKKKLRFMYYENDAEMEACVAAWDMLRKRWKDDDGNTLLVHYTVDIDEANRLLDKAGWVLNKAGEAYKAGTDEVRCKKINDELVPLELKMMYPKGNHMIEFMQEENMFVDNLAKAGIKLEFVAEPMEELLRYYYREKERTTDMIYLATNFHVIVDPSITYSTDTSVGHKVWNNTYSDDKALFDDAVAMRKTEPGSYYEYVEKWMTFQERYNTVLPTIPIYSNIYFDFYTPLLQNYNITNSVTWSQAILLAYFGLPEAEPAEEEVEVGEDEEVFE
jgi:ABC-type transport system substrate-binding protein